VTSKSHQEFRGSKIPWGHEIGRGIIKWEIHCENVHIVSRVNELVLIGVYARGRIPGRDVAWVREREDDERELLIPRGIKRENP